MSNEFTVEAMINRVAKNMAAKNPSYTEEDIRRRMYALRAEGQAREQQTRPRPQGN